MTKYYTVFYRTWMLDDTGKCVYKTGSPSLKYWYGGIDSVRKYLNERIEAFKKNNTIYCDAIDEIIDFTKLSIQKDNTSYILIYDGNLLMYKNNKTLHVIEEWLIVEINN